MYLSRSAKRINLAWNRIELGGPGSGPRKGGGSGPAQSGKPDSALVASMKTRAAYHDNVAAAHEAVGNHAQAAIERDKANVARGQAAAEAARANSGGSRFAKIVKGGLKVASHIVDPFGMLGTR